MINFIYCTPAWLIHPFQPFIYVCIGVEPLLNSTYSCGRQGWRMIDCLYQTVFRWLSSGFPPYTHVPLTNTRKRADALTASRARNPPIFHSFCHHQTQILIESWDYGKFFRGGFCWCAEGIFLSWRFLTFWAKSDSQMVDGCGGGGGEMFLHRVLSVFTWFVRQTGREDREDDEGCRENELEKWDFRVPAAALLAGLIWSKMVKWIW